jgi:hypothetical protein
MLLSQQNGTMAPRLNPLAAFDAVANPAWGFIFPRIQLECAAPSGVAGLVGDPGNKFQ